MIEQADFWLFSFGMMSLAIGAVGFFDAIGSRAEILRIRRKAAAAADNINSAIEAVALDPHGLEREEARSFLIGVAADLEMIATTPPAYPRPRVRRLSQG